MSVVTTTSWESTILMKENLECSACSISKTQPEPVAKMQLWPFGWESTP